MKILPIVHLLVAIFVSMQSLTAQEPFTCKGQYYISLTPNENSNSGLYEVKINKQGTQAELISIAQNIGVVLNAMGYRSVDNLIYGVNPVTGVLSRVGKDGIAQELGRPQGLPFNTRYFAGDITPDGRYLILINIDAVSRFIAKVDLNDNKYTTTITQLRDNNVGIVDIAHDPFSGTLYGHDLRNKQLITIDPNTGNVNRNFIYQPQVNQMGALFFDSFGNLFGYGSYLSDADNTLIAINKTTGEMYKLLVGPNSIGQDGCACPYTIEIAKTVVPDSTFACTEVVYNFIISNGSGALRENIDLIDTFPAEVVFKNIIRNPFGGTVSSQGNILQIKGMAISLGVDTISVLAYVQPNSLGTIMNQAYISGLPISLGSRSASDFPPSVVKNDPTPLTIIPFDVQRFAKDYSLCKGDSVQLDISLYGVDYIWNDGDKSPIKTLTSEHNAVTISTGCEVKAIEMNLNFVDFSVDVIQDTITLNLGEEIELNWISDIPYDEIKYQWLSESPFIPLDSMPYYYKLYPLFDSELVLSAMDTVGCKDQDKVIFRVKKERDVFYPNIMRPNSNEGNAVFMFHTPIEFINGKNWNIYDRWGNLVFHQASFPLNDASYGWNGIFNGKVVEEGVYTWVCEFVFLDNFVATLSGSMTVLK